MPTRRRRRRRHVKKNPAMIALTVILAVVLAGFLYKDRVDSARLGAEMEALDRQRIANQVAEKKRLEEIASTVNKTVEESLPGIVCWGDGLTGGTGGEGISYPSVLDQLVKGNLFDPYSFKNVVNPEYISLLEKYDYTIHVPDVLNMGVDGEDTSTILGRNGATPFITDADFTIPAEKEAVMIMLRSESGKEVAPLRQGSTGMKYVSISGVRGTLSILQEFSNSKSVSYTFTRNQAGDVVHVPEGTVIETEGSTLARNYLPIVFIGENGGYDSTAELIAQQRAIIDHQTKNQDKFIVIGLHTGTATSRADMEEAMQEEYGNRYINLREYMSTQAMEDAGLTPTEEDEQLMRNGSTPESLLASDLVHFNATGYELTGKLVYQRMNELGYFNDVKTVMQQMMQ